MKIAILGPVITKKYFGGVATFDEGLAFAFSQLGYEVLIITTQRSKVTNLSLNIKQVSKLQVVANIRKYKPDLVIASLQYAAYFPFIHYGVKILFLHGFFNFQSYGILKTLLAVGATKFMAKYSDKILANSNFTATINRRIWNIPVDGIAHLGADECFLKKISQNRNSVKKKSGQILFTGRLVLSKRIDTIIRALSLLNRDGIGYNFVLAGDGPELSHLMKLAQQLDVSVNFMGRVSHDEIYKLYQESELFISLGESESFGLTYVEALLSNCKIVCPRTGGQVEFLNHYSKYVGFVNPLDDLNIENTIKQLLLKPTESFISFDDFDKFNYRKTAQSIVNIMSKESV
ncbi:glycosyltransferase family 4 protein [Megasphaera elsdenii]